MPRGKKPKPLKKPSQSENIAAFTARVEQATPAWLDSFEERQAVLVERFMAKDDDGNYVASVAEQARIHQVLTTSESNMLRVACVREQIAKEKGVSHFMEREGNVTNNILNYSPNMTPEQRAYAEHLFLSSVSGKEVEALPAPKILETKAS